MEESGQWLQLRRFVNAQWAKRRETREEWWGKKILRKRTEESGKQIVPVCSKRLAR